MGRNAKGRRETEEIKGSRGDAEFAERGKLGEEQITSGKRTPQWHGRGLRRLSPEYVVKCGIGDLKSSAGGCASAAEGRRTPGRFAQFLGCGWRFFIFFEGVGLYEQIFV